MKIAKKDYLDYRRKVLSVLLMIGLINCLFFCTTLPQEESLFNNYFEPYPNIASLTSTATNRVTIAERALISYDEGDYDMAFQRLTRLAKQNDATFFYRGVCMLALDEPAEAVFLLKLVKTTHALYAPSRWYSALGLLKLKQIKKCREVLDEISKDEKNEFKEKAEELKAKLAGKN